LPDEPFSFRRRVAFGDCDPARIYYTPRAIDYCVEAIEAWWESVLSVSWTDLLAGSGLEVRFFHAESEFIRPLTAGQVVRVRIRVSDTGQPRLSFRVTGEGESGELYFRAFLTAGLFDRERQLLVPISGDDRERIARYEADCGSEEAPPEAALGRVTPAGRGERSPEPGRAQDPPRETRMLPDGLFTRSRRVVYGDCTASGTVYAPKVFGYAVEAVGEWFEEVPGVSWLTLVSVRNQGAPAVAASCDYHRPLAAGQAVAMGVRVIHLGRASLGLSIEGNDPEGEPLFDARITLCYIDQESGFRSMPIPEEFAGRIRAYRASCEAGGRTGSARRIENDADAVTRGKRQ
jgi:acyl-CoA thioesterase FadM